MHLTMKSLVVIILVALLVLAVTLTVFVISLVRAPPHGAHIDFVGAQRTSSVPLRQQATFAIHPSV
jgi:Flp pilus assembly protein CpaB